MEGVIQCFKTGFSDFLTYSTVQQASESEMFGESQWGGSFWHHDLNDSQVQNAFARRIDRLLGRCADVPASVPRVFVRAVNSTEELGATILLYEALREALPQAKVYLLVLIDLQDSNGLVRLSGRAYDEILFYKLQHGLFDDHNMRAYGEAYAEAIAFALRAWAGQSNLSAEILEVPSLKDLETACEPFVGGNPANTLFIPRHITSQDAEGAQNTETEESTVSP